MKSHQLLLGIVALFAANFASAANRPAGYVTLCTENKTCSVATSTNVAFGRADVFFYKTLVGSFVCNEATFGGRTAGGVNECSVPSGTSSSSASSSSKSSSSVSSVSSSSVSSSVSSSISSSSSSYSTSTSGGYVLTNVAASGVATAISAAASSQSATAAVDGNFSTKWVPASNVAGNWLQITFPSAVQLGRVVLSESGEGVTSHDIQVLVNGSWVTVSSGTTIRANKGHDFAIVSTSAVRVFFSAVQAGKPNILEFQAYAVASNAQACAPGNVLVDTVVDCGGVTVGTTCAGGSETQQPVFTLRNSTIRNLRINKNAADGIHCTAGHCRIENTVWEDVCEDAATLKDQGLSLTISGGSANAADDKVFQHNSVIAGGSTINIENFQLYGRIGKLYRSCGDCTGNGGPRYVKINNVQVNGSIGTVVGVNRNYGDKATIRNLRIYKWQPPDSGGEICMEYNGVQKGSGSSSELGLFFNTATCDVSLSDVSGFQ
ncbi:pectate lyase [Viridibacterium curvum]|uniref:pectate lyase n=1 Tax=Viridibacterium curvum TaxID=1101404 RepID=A0ABP9QBL2_9RHOO